MIEWTIEDLEKAILECVKQDEGVREFGSDYATLKFFLERYNDDFKLKDPEEGCEYE